MTPTQRTELRPLLSRLKHLDRTTGWPNSAPVQADKDEIMREIERIVG